MSTRLSIFFLGTVALILVGFSATLYAAASKYLHRQADERLDAALNTLVAAAEFSDHGVEWEPQERRLSFGRRTVEGQFLWIVCDARGRRLDGSTPTDLEPSWTDSIMTATPAGRPRRVEDRGGQLWRVMARRLEAPRTGGSDEADEPSVHEALILGAAVSLSGVGETLRNLALMLTALSCGTWTLALLVGGRLCQRALKPVSEMAEAARAIAGHEFDERLPIAATGDELEDLGRAFNGLLKRQHESHDRQRRFTGDASHQLRTPLTAIQGQVDLALRQTRSAEEYQRVLTVVQGKTRHLRQIVEALLFLARADAESQRPPLEPIELTDWLREHMAAWTGPRPDDVRFEAEGGEAPCVLAHPTLLGELLDNLLDNACKYSEPGTPIVVRASRDGDTVRLSVEDRGVGIEEAAVAHVAAPFYRTPQARSRDSKGLGLGLSVAARLATLFGGRLDVESRPGRGSTFSVVLPTATARPPLDQKSVSI
ncbi:MAG: HAMP domain-containing sensor histidine kinase [Paludisphaera borealis]|uniref:sensor histidine kinase n=1 Tax=Paludisphaera borealis TaxID=1387353 RepID=UPI00283EF56A|nr:HAMP domain-containing sensor histidine kinase [Paludisphaera borealis]MDR3622918.1 HAMP domain-containing sensor histidine kinase [Paludisphaera borealis]